MRRKFTVYGLRFSKTTFWNRLNTGFLEPAVATALTACGIETHTILDCNLIDTQGLQQCLPLAVLKHVNFVLFTSKVIICVATVLTACGIATHHIRYKDFRNLYRCNSAHRLLYATKGASRGVKRR